MKEFDFSRTKLKVKIDGDEYEITIPTVDQADWFDQEVSKIRGKKDEDKIKEITMKYFEKIGLPNKAYKKLEGWQVKELLLYFQDPKKKT